MKKLITLFLCTGFYTLVFAQNPGEATPAQKPAAPKGNANISGGVIDAENNQPVEFATVALLDPATGKPVDGSVCDEKGKFTIHKVAEGTYNVAISFIGYETQTVNGITVDKRSDINLGSKRQSKLHQVKPNIFPFQKTG